MWSNYESRPHIPELTADLLQIKGNELLDVNIRNDVDTIGNICLDHEDTSKIFTDRIKEIKDRGEETLEAYAIFEHEQAQAEDKDRRQEESELAFIRRFLGHTWLNV